MSTADQPIPILDLGPYLAGAPGADRRRQLAERLQGVAVRLAMKAAACRDDMLLERAPLGKPAARPQHLGEVEHRGERLGMLLAEAAAQPVDALSLLGQGRQFAHALSLMPNALPDKPLM